MNILAIIPARKGSKGLPNKNVLVLNKKPLIEYTFMSASESKLLNEIILTTDDERIIDLAEKYKKIKVPFIRPSNISEDNTPIVDVLRHCFNYYSHDVILLLQPTSPFRTSLHIDEAIELFNKLNVDTVVSVCKTPHNFLPESQYIIKDKILERESKACETFIRQNKRETYARNGPAILITKSIFVQNGKLYGNTIAGYLMDKESSLDINDEIDFQVANFLMANRFKRISL